jgi:hypothetical protein
VLDIRRSHRTRFAQPRTRESGRGQGPGGPRGPGGPEDMVLVDRGRGFWAPNSGKITAEFKGALREHGLRTVMGEDASKQPGQLQEMLLHETAESWLRCRLGRSVPAECWSETREQYGARRPFETVLRADQPGTRRGRPVPCLPQALQEVGRRRGRANRTLGGTHREARSQAGH